ncbi:hypothetical protein KO02_04815 [Sphingobacterium sp. ML3W]|uniref:hypothetical protein n=1 Tax=Sphingobacterium sp. ML3W TaxID=1538644 RepID=UPI0004F8AFE2|nr:hypothetical protein [Sphingobacterium sp. ML3W]AIM36088.1 hypothetical protein KO02_04815 [Sphingobacterium sp. ML3W]
MFEDELKNFIKTLNLYMDKFELYSMDVSKLAGSTRDIIKDLDKSKTGLSHKTLSAIGSVFNLKLYQFLDPKYPIKSYEDLPIETKNKIEWRKRVGQPQPEVTYSKIYLKNEILKAISKVKDSNKFLPNEVFSNLATNLQIHLGSSSRVTSSLNSDLKEYVKKTGVTKAKVTLKDGKKEAGRSEEYYRLLKELPKL